MVMSSLRAREHGLHAASEQANADGRERPSPSSDRPLVDTDHDVSMPWNIDMPTEKSNERGFNTGRAIGASRRPAVEMFDGAPGRGRHPPTHVNTAFSASRSLRHPA